MDTSADGLIQWDGRMRVDASGMQHRWDRCAEFVHGRKLGTFRDQISGVGSQTPEQPQDGMMNSVATEANFILSAGCCEWITPRGAPWFRYEPPFRLRRHDSVKKWLNECTEIARDVLAGSNFYVKVQEQYLNWGGMGISSMGMEWIELGIPNFTVYDVGSFVVAENHRGLVDVFSLQMDMTPKQAVEKFGKDKLDAETVRKADENKLDKARYQYTVYPRPDSDRKGQSGMKGKAYAADWIDVKNKTKVKEEGYDLFPFTVPRYLKFSQSSPYGYSPGMQAWAEINNIQDDEDKLDALGRVAVSPPIVQAHADQGVPDLREGGINYGGTNADLWPKALVTPGRLDWGLEMIERRERRVKAMFHQPLFEMFSDLKGDTTAEQIRAMNAERVVRFSPAFSNLSVEQNDPILRWLFEGLAEAGLFPPPPQEAFQSSFLDDRPKVSPPRSVEISRMALMQRQVSQYGVERVISLFAALIEAGSDALDNLDQDEMFRDIARSEGFPDSWLREVDVRDAIRQARAQAAAQAQQQAALMELSKSAPIAQAGVDALKEGQ